MARFVENNFMSTGGMVIDTGQMKGRRIKSRLSKYWLKTLTPSEQNLARFLIRSMVRNEPGEYHNDAIGPYCLIRGNKMGWLNNEVPVFSSEFANAKSVGDVVCNAIYKREFTLDHLRRIINNVENLNPNFGKFVHEVKQSADSESDPESKKEQLQRYKEIQQMVAEQKDELEKLSAGQPEMQLPPDVKKKLEEITGTGFGASFAQIPDASPSAQEPISDIERLLKKFREIIEYLDKGEGPRDVVSNASYKNAGKMLQAGIPVEAILYAYALTWPESVRKELEIETFNVQEFGEAKKGQHKAVPYVEALVNAGVPCMLVGPTQAGKGFLSKNIAENRGLQYGSVPLSAGTSISWLFGRNMPRGFVGTDLIRCYENGGVFLLDEMDAADSNLLIGINDALSNGELSNPVVDQRIKKHENFISLAAANTWGLGADADYTGRERLDMATLERWRMGRVKVDYDRGLQEMILRSEAEQSDDNTGD
jgi:AAA domain (dynein-related subfamily)